MRPPLRGRGGGGFRGGRDGGRGGGDFRGRGGGGFGGGRGGYDEGPPWWLYNALYLTSCPPRSKVLSIRCQGRGRPRKNTTPDDGDIHQSSDDQSSSQEEIITLFKRIQTSIAKEGGFAAIKKRRSDSQKDRKAAENVLDVLRQSRNKNKDDKVISNRQEPKIKEELEDVSAAPEVNFTRPPSNFVKKSPSEIVEIPSENIETGIEKMKVSELKELAKSRGIKGYSKLKKGMNK